MAIQMTAPTPDDPLVVVVTMRVTSQAALEKALAAAGELCGEVAAFDGVEDARFRKARPGEKPHRAAPPTPACPAPTCPIRPRRPV